MIIDAGEVEQVCNLQFGVFGDMDSESIALCFKSQMLIFENICTFIICRSIRLGATDTYL